MEKIKINVNETEFDGWEKIGLYGNDAIMARMRIPMEEKERFALELAESTIVLDPESGVAYQSYLYEVIFMFLIVKYFTNINVEELDTEDGHKKLYDYLSNNGLTDKLTSYICKPENDDLMLINDMYDKIREAISSVYREKNGLAYKIKTSFASVLSSEDLSESLAKSQDVNAKMIDVLGAVMEHTGKKDNILNMNLGKR